MPRTCSICAHPELAAINEALVSGITFRNIAERYGTSLAALHRHKHDHIPAALAKAGEAAEVTHADDLLEQVRGLQKRALNILETAEVDGKLGTALLAIKESRGCLELLARLLDKLPKGSAVNILISSPAWVELRAVIVDTLGPYPQIQAELGRRLARIERRGDSGRTY